MKKLIERLLFRTLPDGRRAFSLLRLAGLCACLLVAGYLALATAAYVYIANNIGTKHVGYFDILLPNRWSVYRHARGINLLETAMVQSKAANHREAFFNLRMGVALAPEHIEGRLLLARYLLDFRRPDLTEETLLKGLQLQPDSLVMIRSTFDFLFQRQADLKALELASQMIRPHTGDQIGAKEQLLALAAATALYYRGNYDAAEDWIERYRLTRTKDARLLLAKSNWERGYRDLGIVMLYGLAEDLNEDMDVYVQLAEYLRAENRHSAAKQLSIIQLLAHPAIARPRIDLLYEYSREGDLERINAEAEILFHDFSTNRTMLFALGDFAANVGNVTLARRILRYCEEKELPIEAPSMMVAEALVVSGQHQAAIDFITDLLKVHPDWENPYQVTLNGLQAVAYYGVNDHQSGQLYVNKFLLQPNLRPANLYAIARRLIVIGAKAQARDILARASALDPNDQATLTHLIELDLEMNNIEALPANLNRLIANRKPSPAVLQAAERKLGSDLFLFSPNRAAILDALRAQLSSVRQGKS